MKKIDNNYLTPQEHKLFGSTVTKYEKNPYIPIVVQDGMSIEKCDLIRQERKDIAGIIGSYWGEKYFDCKMSLEKLDENGETIKDPALMKLGIFYEKIKDYSTNFPYKRETKPRVELENE